MPLPGRVEVDVDLGAVELGRRRAGNGRQRAGADLQRAGQFVETAGGVDRGAQRPGDRRVDDAAGRP